MYSIINKLSHFEDRRIVRKDNTSTEGSNERRQLFRQEAIDNVSAKQYGSILLANDVGQSALTWFCIAIAIAILSFFYFFTTTKKASAQGVIVAKDGLAKVYPPLSGVISQKLVSDGQTVQKGQTLFIVTSEIDGNGAQSTQANISLLLRDRIRSIESEIDQSVRLFQERNRTAAKKRLDLESDVRRLEHQIELQVERLSLSLDVQARYKQLQATSFVSSAQLQEKSADVIDQQQRLSELRGQKSALFREIATTEANAREISYESQQSQEALTRSVLAVKQDLVESERRREFTVKAPYSGSIVTITADAGQAISTSTSLATIIPKNTQIEAELYVPSSSIGLIEPGQTVFLRYQAYPYQKYGQHEAIVRDIAVTALKPEELGLRVESTRRDMDEIYRVRLAIGQPFVLAHGVKRPLKIGMGLEASVIIDRRPLYQWVLEPLFSITGRN